MNGKIWTESELDVLRKHYENCNTSDLMRLLPGRTLCMIYNAAHKIGLKKDPEIISKMTKQNWENGEMEACRKTFYPKGHKPANKGKKQEEYMSAEQIARSRKTCFQKGNLPHNTNYDGHERITKDGYIEVRIRLGKYVLKHRHEWEKVNGPVPKGMILTFKDGIKTNTAPENMKLITMAENMKRNSYLHYPAEVREILHIKKSITRKIKQHTKNHEKQD